MRKQRKRPFPTPTSVYNHMLTTTRARWLSLILLTIALLALLGLGALKLRQDFLLRGIPAELPGPIAHAGTQLGLNVYLNQYDDDELAENLTQIADAGIQHIKQPFYYSEDFDWDEADRVITAVTAANLTLTPLLDGNPADNFAPPANPNDYAQWAESVRPALRRPHPSLHHLGRTQSDNPLGQSARQRRRIRRPAHRRQRRHPPRRRRCCHRRRPARAQRRNRPPKPRRPSVFAAALRRRGRPGLRRSRRQALRLLHQPRRPHSRPRHPQFQPPHPPARSDDPQWRRR